MSIGKDGRSRGLQMTSDGMKEVWQTEQRSEQSGGTGLLTANDEGEWGEVTIQLGARTPWGEADSVSHVAPGIVTVGTPGHGGIKLSKERNAAIPTALRNRSGWYEEDCESAIVGMYHPEAFPHVLDRMGPSGTEAYFEGNVMSNFPDQYTKATGRDVPVGASWVLQRRAEAEDKAAFRAAHANEFVTLGNGDTSSQQSWIPKGWAIAPARMDATGETRDFLVRYDEVIENKSWGRNALIDPNRHIDVTGIRDLAPASDKPTVVSGDDLDFDTTGLTPAKARQAREELDKRYRFSVRNDDGTVGEIIETTEEHLRRVGVTDKKRHSNESGKGTKFYVSLGDGTAMTIKEGTYNALTQVPDATSVSSEAYLAYSKLQAKHDTARSNFDTAAAAKLKPQVEAAKAAYQEASETERQEHRRAYDARMDMRRMAFELRLAEHGLNLADLDDED